jgi:hypothetical protein
MALRLHMSLWLLAIVLLVALVALEVLWGSQCGRLVP